MWIILDELLCPGLDFWIKAEQMEVATRQEIYEGIKMKHDRLAEDITQMILDKTNLSHKIFRLSNNPEINS